MTSDLRHSAGNLQLLASHYENMARVATCEHEADAWNTMVLRLLDAADVAAEAADDVDGIWRLPLEIVP